MKSPIVVLILCLTTTQLLSQSYHFEGKVLNCEDNSPIPFASIAINNKDIGTVADENGVFNYSCSSISIQNDIFIISSIGYHSKKYCVNELNNKTTAICLSPKVTEIEQVIVRPNNEYKTVKLGKANHFGLGGIDYSTSKEKSNVDKLGRELGAIINIDDDKIYKVEALNFYVVGTQFEKVTFRILFYNLKDGRISSPGILAEDILYETDNKPGWKKIDLTKYNIILHDTKEVAATLQWVKGVPLDGNSKYFSLKATSSPIKGYIYRNKSLAEWHFISGNISIYLDAKYCKK